jgi:hypothetical protein
MFHGDAPLTPKINSTLVQHLISAHWFLEPGSKAYVLLYITSLKGKVLAFDEAVDLTRVVFSRLAGVGPKRIDKSSVAKARSYTSMISSHLLKSIVDAHIGKGNDGKE